MLWRVYSIFYEKGLRVGNSFGFWFKINNDGAKIGNVFLPIINYLILVRL